MIPAIVDVRGRGMVTRWVCRSHRGRHATALVVLALVSAFAAHAACGSDPRRGTLPNALTDEQFWRLSTGFSEPGGAFAHSDNLVSNETHFVHAVRMLGTMGGIYIGVGPEQNFSYIARLRPAMAFIIDIRQENRRLHLMYKALFDLSADRADFVSRLFSRERPAGLGPKTSVQDLFAKYETARPAGSLYEGNARAVGERLLDLHGFSLSADDLAGIEAALRRFYSDGPDIHYGRSYSGAAPDPSYRSLMTATDISGRSSSYLATEDSFTFLKDLHAKNMIVPVVGDFAGPHAIRRVGDHIRLYGGRLSAFYASNVEVYLNRQQTAAFCGSLATLPYDSRTWFIGSKGMRRFASKLEACLASLRPAVTAPPGLRP
jgi:hypothetical protein